MFPLYIVQLTSTTITPQLQPSLCTGWGITPPFHWTSTQSVFPWDVLLILKYSLKKRDVVIISLGTTKTLFIHRYILAKFVFTYKAYGQIFKHTTDYWGHTIRNSCHCWMWTWLKMFRILAWIFTVFSWRHVQSPQAQRMLVMDPIGRLCQTLHECTVKEERVYCN